MTDIKMNVRLIRSTSRTPDVTGAVVSLASDNRERTTVLPSRTTTKVRTGVAIDVHDGCVGVVLPAAGFTDKGGSVVPLVVQPGDEGEIILTLKATTSAIEVEPGDPVAGLIILPAGIPHLQMSANSAPDPGAEPGAAATTRKKAARKKAVTA